MEVAYTFKKKLTASTQTHINHGYYKLRWLQARSTAKNIITTHLTQIRNSRRRYPPGALRRSHTAVLSVVVQAQLRGYF